MSPDILQGFAIGLHDDIYSFGITMWQLKSNSDPYQNITSHEFVAYHVVKDNLRPDSQSKHYGNQNENENLSTIQLIRLNADAADGNERSKLKVIKPSKRALSPITPVNKRMKLEIKPLTTGNVRRQIKAVPREQTSAVKKLDFNSMFTANCIPFSSGNVNVNPLKDEFKICMDSNDTVDSSNVCALFKESYQHLSIERRMKIEKSYENIYKQCWDHDAAKRPSADAILGLIKSTFRLFD